MRTVAEHLAACLEIARAAAPLDVVLPDAVGCVLAQDVVAGIDLPAVDLAGQDGYAVITAQEWFLLATGSPAQTRSPES